MPSRTSAALGPALLLAAPAAAQPSTAHLAVDAGVAHIRQAGTPGLTAPSAGATLDLARRRTLYRAAAAVAAGDGRGAAQLALGAASTVGAVGPVPVAVDAEMRAARVPNTPWALLALAGVRADAGWGQAPGAGAGVRGPGAGVWARALVGASRQAGGASPSAGVETGAWRATPGGGRLTIAAAAANARVTWEGLVASGFDVYGPPLGPARVGVATGDVAASYERAGPRVELTLAAGARGYRPRGLRALPADDADPDLPGPPLRWRPLGTAAATVWLVPAVGLAAEAGLAPNDPVRGLPAARYATLGVRLRSRWNGGRPGVTLGARGGGALGEHAAPGNGASGNGAPSSGASVDGGSEPGGAAVRLLVAPAERGAANAPRRVVVHAPTAARRVQLRADVTGWRAVDLARGADGGWAAAVGFGSGPHRVQVRVDGGAWGPPQNLPAADDEFGGRVGLLVVP